MGCIFCNRTSRGSSSRPVRDHHEQTVSIDLISSRRRAGLAAPPASGREQEQWGALIEPTHISTLRAKPLNDLSAPIAYRGGFPFLACQE
jgi:hypothetical protein